MIQDSQSFKNKIIFNDIVQNMALIIQEKDKELSLLKKSKDEKT